MSKSANIAKVGQIIRSYDFKPMHGRPDCFVEGRVLGFTNKTGYDSIEIRVLVDQFDGKRFEEMGRGSRVGEIIYVPIEVSMMEYPGRVMNLSE